jgi:hypothetical protein
LDEKLKATEREVLLKDSQFAKEKALLDHKIQHYEKVLEDYNKKEKHFDQSLDSTRMDFNQ